MITSRHRGFFTASLMILLLVFAISAASLTLIQSADLPENCFGAFDRRYIRAYNDIKTLENHLNADPRDLDLTDLKIFFTSNDGFQIKAGPHPLIFVKSQWEESLGRIRLIQSIDGREHIRFIEPQITEEGRVRLFLSGIMW